MNLCNRKLFLARVLSIFATNSFLLFSNEVKAEYIYIKPTEYLQVQSVWYAGPPRPTSAEAACESIAQGYTKLAGPPYSGLVQKLTQSSPTAAWLCYLDRTAGDGIWYHDSDYDGVISKTPECPKDFVFDTRLLNSDGSIHLRCLGVKNENLQVSLVGPNEALPAGIGSNSDITFTAKVTDGNSPKAGVQLGFSVEVTPNSGGHEHHDVARPKGAITPIQGITDANGEVKVSFKAPELAGIHTLKATCSTCTNSPVIKEIQVKVPDLLAISPNPPQNMNGSFVYALTSVDKTHQGNGRYHHNQYYLTEQSQINLQSMINSFAAEGWGTVALNDASLYWGGRYDITANWGAPHAGHREGREIDISFSRAQNPVSVAKQNDFYDKFCKNKKVNFPFSILHHYLQNPHYHVFLEKQTACYKSEK